MENFNISQKEPAFELLKKFLTIDPKHRITSIEAIQDIYLHESPQLLRDAFSYFTANIPFPLRQNLTAKKLTTAAATVNHSTQNNKYSIANSATAASVSQMQYICKPISSLPITNC